MGVVGVCSPDNGVGGSVVLIMGVVVFKVCLFCVYAALETTGEESVAVAPPPPEVLSSRGHEWKRRVCSNTHTHTLVARCNLNRK